MTIVKSHKRKINRKITIVKQYKRKRKKERLILNIRYKTKTGLGVGKFYHIDEKTKKKIEKELQEGKFNWNKKDYSNYGKLILDETKGLEVKPQYTLWINKENTFGSLRNLKKK